MYTNTQVVVYIPDIFILYGEKLVTLQTISFDTTDKDFYTHR